MIFAQISDTHIRPQGRLAYRKVDTAAALAACVAHLNALAPRPAFALVTGDLVDFGSPAEYRRFRELMAPLEIPYFVIPGNHDERGALRSAFADAAYLPKGGEFLHYAIEGHPLRILALDSVVPGAPHGELGAERLAWLEARLAEMPDRPTVIATHHPPFLTGIRHMDVQNCRDGEALGAVVERHPQVRALLCGHVHRFAATLWHGILATICPSPSHAVALDLDPEGPSAFSLDPPACLIHTWTPEGRLVSHISFIGRFDGPYPFFDAAGRLID
jgi:3',5'-cyclic AMP phosphodiesterase CpdA